MYARSLWGEGWVGGWGRREKKERERERREGGGCKGGFEKLLFSSGSFFSFFFFPHSFRFFILLVLSLRLLSLLSPFSPREHAARALTHEQADSGCSGSSGSGSLRSLVRSVSRSFCLARAEKRDSRSPPFSLPLFRSVPASHFLSKRRGSCRTAALTQQLRKTEQESAGCLASEAGVGPLFLCFFAHPLFDRATPPLKINK